MSARLARAALLLGALALAAGCSDAASAPEISGEALAARIAAGSAPLVLDVRTPGGYASGHVPGARNIPHTELGARRGELGPDARERVQQAGVRLAALLDERLAPGR